jgi:hypothetical protein
MDVSTGCLAHSVMSYLPFATNCGGRGVFRTDPRLLVGDDEIFFENLTFVRLDIYIYIVRNMLALCGTI